MTTQEKIQYIVDWIKNYATQSGRETLIVGCSGGIDSSVVSTLCAMTGLEVRAYEIDIHSLLKNSEIAQSHTEWLESKFSNVFSDSTSLDRAFYEFILFEDFSELAKANTKSRLRMAYLYAQANTHNGLVVGCGNKVEDFGIGFATVGGDLVSDISPIGDLYKSEVYEIGRELNLLDSVLQAKPTDGLWEGSPSDEEQIGATYDELEWAMEWATNHNNSLAVQGKEFTERQHEVMRIYLSLHAKNQHKMKPIPVCKIPQ
jgi:NAD+ synthase